MLTIETKELNISEEVKRKFDMICKFACIKRKYKKYGIIIFKWRCYYE